MKAENEHKGENLRDERLSELLKSNKDSADISSNFTHQVMGKIENLGRTKKSKPLISWWAWIIIGGSFVTALILAIVYAPMPENSTPLLKDAIGEINPEIKQYLSIATIVMAVIFVDMFVRYQKTLGIKK